MFEPKKKKITVPTVETTTITVPTLHGIKQAVLPAVSSAATQAKSWGDEQAQAGQEWAQARRDAAAPALAAAGENLAARRDEALARFEEKRDDLRAKAEDSAKQAQEQSNAKLEAFKKQTKAQKKAAAKNVKKASKKAQKKAPTQQKDGGLLSSILVALGVLAVAGAIAAYVTKKQSQPKDDPWARPLTDPYTAPQNRQTGTIGTATPATTGTGAPGTTGTTGAASGVAGTAAAGDATMSHTPGGSLDERTTPTAPVADADVVDLTDDGMPPEGDVEARDTTNRTLGDGNDKGRI